MNNTTHSNDQGDSDIPVLTDIIDEKHSSATSEVSRATAPEETGTTPDQMSEDAGDLRAADLHAAALPSLEQIQAELSSRLTAELTLQIPVLLEAALREHLPKAIGARLQAELLSALANALPGAAQNAAAELSSTLAFEVGGLLEQRLESEVRRAVADEIARLSDGQQPSR